VPEGVTPGPIGRYHTSTALPRTIHPTLCAPPLPPSSPSSAMTSGVERLPRTLQLSGSTSTSPLRDTTFSGEYHLFTLRVVLICMDVKMAESARNMNFYQLRTLRKQRAALPMGPTCCSPCIMKRRRNMTRSWRRTGGRMRKASCS
jgi:hypothetical protein